jgi:hypothetical protein
MTTFCVPLATDYWLLSIHDSHRSLEPQSSR